MGVRKIGRRGTGDLFLEDLPMRVTICGRFALGCAFLAVACAIGRADDVVRRGNKLVVHEWGTFTALQDEAGNPIGGINVDDEPVPAFVHNLNYRVLGSQYDESLAALFSKGAPTQHPLVTMRLETPVMYFYL